MRQVSVLVHLDLRDDDWPASSREIEDYVCRALRLCDLEPVDAEVMPEPERPAVVPWPENVPAVVALDENVPQALRRPR